MPIIQATDCPPGAFAMSAAQFDTSYARLPERFYARLTPTPVRGPRMVKFNSPLAEELGLEAKQ